MRLKLHEVVLGLALASFVTPAFAVALQASSAQQAATNVYFDCLVHAAQGADDHTSDPSTLALRIEPSCTAAEAQEQARFRTNLAPGSAAKFDQLWPAVRQATAVKAILISRGAPTVPASQ